MRSREIEVGLLPKQTRSTSGWRVSARWHGGAVMQPQGFTEEEQTVATLVAKNCLSRLWKLTGLSAQVDEGYCQGREELVSKKNDVSKEAAIVNFFVELPGVRVDAHVAVVLENGTWMPALVCMGMPDRNDYGYDSVAVHVCSTPFGWRYAVTDGWFFDFFEYHHPEERKEFLLEHSDKSHRQAVAALVKRYLPDLPWE